MGGKTSYKKLEQKVKALEKELDKHQQAKNTLRTYDMVYSGTLNDMLSSIGLLDHNGKIILANNTSLRVAGLKPSDVIGRKLYEAYWWQYSEETKETIKKAIHECAGGKTLTTEIEAQIEDGGLMWIEFSMHPIHDEEGSVKYLVAEGRDITERKQAEDALRKSEIKYSTLVENARDCILIIQDGKLVFANKMSFDLIGYEPEELMNIDFINLIAPEYRKISKDKYEERKAGKKVPAINEVAIKRKDNTIVPVEVNITQDIEYEGKTAELIFIRDISERLKAQEEKAKLAAQLHQAQKMEALGALSSGIAHDFNNILTLIIGYNEIISMRLPGDHEVQEDLNEIFNAGKRARDLTQQILAFSRQTEQKLQPVNAELIVKEVLRLLRASLPATIEIRQNIHSDALIMANPIQIHQILMNLSANAAYAMQEKGGVLKIEVITSEPGSGFVSKHSDLKPGPHICLTVSDTGHGMTPDVLDRIFDPFFTTKAASEGTGMGLSVVCGIVKQLHGVIDVFSEPGNGSTFKIFLPAHDRRMETRTWEDQANIIGTESILYIDDEKSITNMAKQLLELLGYRVTISNSGHNALARFKSNPEAFDLVITDMTMPSTTGDKLAKELLNVRPGIPLILCSGNSAWVTEDKVKSMGFSAFVEKPIIKRDLSETIRKVLDA
jgi:PAS domain S-box-containing protein